MIFEPFEIHAATFNLTPQAIPLMTARQAFTSKAKEHGITSESNLHDLLAF